MKRISLFLLLLLPLFSPALRAQEVFRLVRQTAERAATAPGSSFVQREVARFQIDALDLLENEGAKHFQEQGYTVFLDTQAYSLSQFMTALSEQVLFKRRITPEKAEEQMWRFRTCTERHPLFPTSEMPDADAYLQDENSPTPFSLNTDWEAAFDALKR